MMIGRISDHQKSGIAAISNMFERAKATGRLLGKHGRLGVLSVWKNACTTFHPLLTRFAFHGSPPKKKSYNHQRDQFQFAGNRGGVFPYLSPMAFEK